jgi:hypothetical protein
MGDESLFWAGRLDALMPCLGLSEKNMRPKRDVRLGAGTRTFPILYRSPRRVNWMFDQMIQSPTRCGIFTTGQSRWSRVYPGEHRPRIALAQILAARRKISDLVTCRGCRPKALPRELRTALALYFACSLQARKPCAEINPKAPW